MNNNPTLREAKNSLVSQIIRTGVPALVGAVASWLATMNIVLNDEIRNAAVLFGSVLATVLYYSAIAWLEKRYPTLSILLGSRKQPTEYKEDPDEPVTVIAVEDLTELIPDGHGRHRA